VEIMTEKLEHTIDQEVHKAVVVDEHTEWLDTAEQMLVELGIDVVGKETSPAAALSRIDREQPDLLVIHAGAEREQSRAGFECLRLVREQCASRPRAIVFGAPGEGSWVDTAFEAGAAACIAETAALEDIASAIRQVFSQSVHFRGAPDAGATA
jgi:DNA-binding NarL/FixJ family response regulator